MSKVARSKESRKKWHDIWMRAFQNLPYREGRQKETVYLPRPKHTTPIPELIKGVAKNTLMVQDDRVYEKVINVRTYKYGQQSLLGRLLGMTLKNPKNSCKRGKVNHNWVYRNYANGCIPRDINTALLLMRLADPKKGKRLANRMVRKLPNAKHYKYD